MSCASTLPAYPAVQSALADIRAGHGVHIPLAVESGSRAWGFPSPDSDYDARFVFVRPAAAHLTPWPGRDVIELPISGKLDVNGWDLAKALQLLLKGDAVVIEWLQSPLIYAVDSRFRAEMLAFADRYARRDAVARHYLHLGLRQWREFIEGRDEVKPKTLFHALRPAAALLAAGASGTGGRADGPAGADGAERSASGRGGAVDALIAKKAQTREMGSAPAPAGLTAFIRAEFEAAAGWEAADPPPPPGEAREAAAALYRATVERLDAGEGAGVARPSPSHAFGAGSSLPRKGARCVVRPLLPCSMGEVG